MVKCLKNIKSFLKIKVPTKYAKFALQQYYLITKCIEICMFFLARQQPFIDKILFSIQVLFSETKPS